MRGMARSDYHDQLLRHVGEWDVLPCGLPRPSLPHGSDWSRSGCRGIALLSDSVVRGNRWPALSGALLAELALRCATLAALAHADETESPQPRDISVRFRRTIPIADPRTRPHIADGAKVLYWESKVAAGGDVDVRMERRLPSATEPVLAVEATATFDRVEITPDGRTTERRMADYLFSLPRRLALPAYRAGWTNEEIRGLCREPPGSLVGVAEQALGDAGKIIRGDGTPEDMDESMLLASMTYRWIAPDIGDDAEGIEYVARPGARSADDKGRDWVPATATLHVGGRPVGEAEGLVVLRRFRRGGSR